jgi:hypothetical protein
MTPEPAWILGLSQLPCKTDATCGRLPASQAAQTVVERLIWLFSPAFGRTAPVGWTCMHAIEGLMLALVVAAAVVLQ